MNEQEKEEILYRLDERTKRVDDHLGRLDDRVSENQASIESLEKLTDRNTRDIGYGKALLGFFGAILSTVSAKIFGLVQL